MGTWIDFKKLREQLDFAAVLAHYGVALKANAAGQHHGKCPLPHHPKESTSLSFSVNLKKKVFRCFSCNAGGNCLDFAILMTGGNPDAPADVRTAAIMLAERFGLQQSPESPSSPAPTRITGKRTLPPSKRIAPPVAEQKHPAPRGEVEPVQTLVNAPLDFALKNLDGDCAFLLKRGFLKATIAHFGMGLCTKGTFAGRIAIPLHNLEGRLVGYTGLITDTFEDEGDAPRYLWPNAREHNGMRHELDRTKLVYHANKVIKPAKDLVVVQAIESAWWVHQCGFMDVVAIMGDAPSHIQSEIMVDLVSPTGRIWLLTDGTKLGERCAQELFFDLGQHRFCTWIRLPEGRPDEYESADIQRLLEWSVAS